MSKGEDIGCAHRTAIASGDGCRASVLGARTGSIIPPLLIINRSTLLLHMIGIADCLLLSSL
jgi:hypothetical protein